MAKTFYIPNGPANLANLFPEIPFGEVAEYSIEVLDEDDNVIATTPLNKIGCCCPSDGVRILFLNHLGTFDGINLQKPDVIQKPESGNYKKGLPSTFSKQASGNERIINAVGVKKVGKNGCYQEKHSPWVKQLFSSPKAYEEQVIDGKPSVYVPIVIADQDLPLQKNEREYNYDFALEYTMSNQEIPIRN